MEVYMTAAKKVMSLRVSEENKELIRMAASFTGHDLTSYITSIALERAKEDIIKHKEVQALLLSNNDFDKVISELDSSPKVNSKLKKAFSKNPKA